ncbi:MAG: hypothetical protein IH614_07265 [Desulfuromonadales bacterium]|nr:hypothetical protein [Desulfuromonadales bacterium]
MRRAFFRPSIPRFLLLLPLLLPWVPAPVQAEPTWSVRTPGDRPLPDRFLRSPDPDLGAEAANPDIDLDHHLLVGEAGPYRLQLGRQHGPEKNLVLGEGERRGLAFSLRGGPRQAGLTAFALRPEERTAEPLATGLEDPQNRFTGLAASITPRSDRALSLRLSGMVVAGSLPAPGGGTGEAWTLVADTGLLSRLRLRAELAGSRSGRVDAGDDGASSLSAVYTSSLQLRRQSLLWHLGGETERVDPFFASPGHPRLLTDRQGERVFAGVRGRRLGVQGSIGQERDNLAGVSGRPTVQTDLYSVFLDWLPELQSLPEFLGRPTVKVGVSGWQKGHLRLPPGRAPIDRELRKLQGGIDFQHRRWNWGVEGSVSDYDDFTAVSGLRTQTIGGRAGTRIGQRLSLGPSWHWRLSEDSARRQTAEATTFGLNGSVVLVPHRWRGSWDLGLQRQIGFDQLVSQAARVQAELLYHWISPRRTRPGYDLSLRWQWREPLQVASAERDYYRLFLGLTLIFPPS